MDITKQLQAKAQALRSVQAYIKELQKLNIQDLEEVNKYIESQINSYKQLVKDLNHGQK